MSFGPSRVALVVMRKEIFDGLRDRRSLLSAFLFPLFMPLMFGFLMNTVAKMRDNEKPLEIAVIGQERAPQLMSYLEQEGAILSEAPDDPEQAVRDGRLDVVLEVPEEFPDKFLEASPAEVRLIIDSSRTDSSAAIGRTRALLQTYSRTTATLRLMARGVSPQLREAVTVGDVDLATPEKLAARLISFLPMLLILAPFVAGFNLATDVTAGERERRSLEPLLLNPVSTLDLVLGKWIATMALSLTGVVLMLACTMVVLGRVPLEDLGVRMDLGPLDALRLLVVALPMVPLASAAQMLVATFARSFKEAQSYVNLLIFLPMIPAVGLQIHPLKPTLSLMLVPALSQQLLLVDVMRGEPRPLAWLAVASIVAIALALVAAWATSRLLRLERIVFGH